MKLITKPQILASLDTERALSAIEEGFIAYSAGNVQVPPVQAFTFAETIGDCCIKSAYKVGSPTFTVKVSTGFYDWRDGSRPGCSRPHRSRPSASWAQACRPACNWSSCAAQPVQRFAQQRRADNGVLGPHRPAAGPAPGPRLAHGDAHGVTDCRQVIVWGRHAEGLGAYVTMARDLGFTVRSTHDAAELAGLANLIVSATPSREPLLQAHWIQPGTHITAVGADGPGKQELDPGLVARADRLVVDSITQCAQYGEVSHAIGKGLVTASQLVELGALLASRARGRESDDQITLADLTGVAVQDAQIADCVLAAIGA